MKTADTIQADKVSSETTASVCQIVVVYEDLAAHDRAMEVASRLVTQFAGDPALVFSSWNFKELAEPSLSHQAIDGGARADVILICGHGNELPSAVRAWLDACASGRTKPEGALALLLAEPFMLSASSDAILKALEYMASRMRMDFVSLVPLPAERMIASLQAGAALADSLRQELLERPRFDHWGLNE